MKVAKKVIIALVLILLPFLSIHLASASEGSSSVTVSYTPDRTYAYVKLKVEVEGNGEVLDMNQPIRSGIVIYDIQEGDSKTFTIHPDEGYIIGMIEYFNGYDTAELSPQLKDSRITVIAVGQDAVLKVRFEKEKSDSVPDKESNEMSPAIQEKPNDIQQNVQTSDMTNKEIVLVLMGTSLILMIIVWKRNKDSKDGDFRAGNTDERK